MRRKIEKHIYTNNDINICRIAFYLCRHEIRWRHDSHDGKFKGASRYLDFISENFPDVVPRPIFIVNISIIQTRRTLAGKFDILWCCAAKRAASLRDADWSCAHRRACPGQRAFEVNACRIWWYEVVDAIPCKAYLLPASQMRQNLTQPCITSSEILSIIKDAILFWEKPAFRHSRKIQWGYMCKKHFFSMR